MTLAAWRIVQGKHRRNAFTGEGARLFGGRWNSPGTAVVYLSASQSLAVLELLVHLETTRILEHYLLYPVRFTEVCVETLEARRWPTSWRASPPRHETQQIGDEWVRTRRTPLLAVPSAVVSGEWNYLFNPAHRQAFRVRVGAPQRLQLDARLRRLLHERGRS